MRISAAVTLSAIIVSAVFSLIPVNRAHAVGWYNASWGYRTKITIDHTKVPNTNQTDFPVLISKTDNRFRTVANGGHMGNAGGTDMLFTSDDGTTKLKHEIEKYSATTGQIIVWVKVPTLSTSTDTDIYIYYGNAGVADQSDAANVWTNGYKQVLHMGDGTTLSTTDSSGNYNATNSNANATSSGVINGAVDFDVAGDRLNNANGLYTMVGGSATHTVSAWVRVDNPSFGSATNYFFDGDHDNSIKSFANAAIATQIEWGVGGGGCFRTYTSVSPALSVGAYSYITMVKSASGNNGALYVNGTLQSTYSGALCDLPANTTTSHWGNYHGGSSATLVGKMDEMHISTSARSADWVATEYNNQNSPSTFAPTWATEETAPSNTAPDTPTSLGPANRVNGSYTTSNQPTLSFTLSDTDVSDTVKFRIQIATSASFTAPVVDYTSALAAQGSTSFTVGQGAGTGSYTTGASSQTLSDASYYWRVKAIDSSASESAYATANSGSVAFIVDTTAPTVSNVTSSTANGSYNAGDVISIQVAFTEAVTVTGTPQLTLSTGSPSTTAVNYATGSGTSTLTFNYTVSSGNTSSDLDYATATSLGLNSGTIADAAGNNATLTLAAPGAAGSLGANKNIVIDTTAPTISEVTPVTTPTNDATPDYTFTTNEAGTISYGGDCSSGTVSASVGSNTVTFSSLSDGAHTNCTVTVTDTAGNASNTITVTAFTVDATAPTVSNVTSSTANGSYNAGDSISIQIVFTEAVTVTGTPQLTLSTGSPTTTAVDYATGSGTNTLTFTYLVASGNTSSDLDYATTNSLALNSGTIRDAASNNATLTLVAAGAAGSLGANKAIVIDTTAPVISEVTPVSTPTSDNTPNYTFTTNEAGTISYGGDCSSATTSASSGSNTVTFSTLSDGAHTNCTITVTDTAGNASNTITVTSFTVDATVPTVSNVTSSTSNGSYNAGDAISIQVVFTEAVTVTGTPQLTLSTGSPSTTAVNYATGSGTTTLTFTYTVSSGNTSSDLDYATSSSLGLNSGTIRDSASNNATLALAAPGAAGSLGANKNIVIDTTAPTLSETTAVTTPAGDLTPDYTFTTDEAGTISYGGDCSSSTSSASSGANTITLAALSVGAHTNCTIIVTDAAGNASSTLNVTSFTIVNPVPSLSSVSPSTRTAGGSAFTLTLSGSDFVSDSEAKVDGVARTTTYVSASSLTIEMTAADISAAGSLSITVTNPAPGGGTSSAQTITVSAASSGSGQTRSVAVPMLKQISQQQRPIDSPGKQNVPAFVFTKNLWTGFRDAQVIELQKFLNARGYVIAATGPGSPGQETSYFGKKTRDALARLQLDAGLVSSPAHPSLGVFGPATRAYANGIR